MDVHRAGTLERKDKIGTPITPSTLHNTWERRRAPDSTRGTRGTTGHDMAQQRALLKGRDRMLADTAARVAELADGDSWVVLGGIKRETSQLEGELASIAPHRVITLPSLDVHASEAEIAVGARAGAAELAGRGRRQTRRRDRRERRRRTDSERWAPQRRNTRWSRRVSATLYVTDRYVGRYERDRRTPSAPRSIRTR